MHNPASMFDSVVPRPLGPAGAASAFAPANIALAKYWGKRDATLNLPLNSSLSISLGDLGTTTRIAPATVDTLSFNSKTLDRDAPAAAKIWAFVDLFCGRARPGLAIETENTIPTAAGLASSASGFAALTRALDRAFGTDLPAPTLSMLARFGSGSATRSLWSGFARWDKGTRTDGRDSRARPVPTDLPGFRIGIVTVDSGPKAQTSTDGMIHTVTTSPLYDPWPAQAEADCDAIERHLIEGDFAAMGALAETNALAMHATMMAARPPLCYLQAQSWDILHRLWAARRDGLPAFATMDAGPNVKLLFEDAARRDVLALFPGTQIINPFK